MIRIASCGVSLRRRAIAAVELALVLPLLAFLFVVAVDYARIFYYSMTIKNCARNGAIYGSQKPVNATDTAGIQAAAKMDAGNLNTNLMTVSTALNSKSGPTTLSVTVSYPFHTVTHFPGIASTTTLTRTVSVNISPLVPN